MKRIENLYNYQNYFVQQSVDNFRPELFYKELLDSSLNYGLKEILRKGYSIGFQEGTTRGSIEILSGHRSFFQKTHIKEQHKSLDEFERSKFYKEFQKAFDQVLDKFFEKEVERGFYEAENQFKLLSMEKSVLQDGGEVIYLMERHKPIKKIFTVAKVITDFPIKQKDIEIKKAYLDKKLKDAYEMACEANKYKEDKKYSKAEVVYQKSIALYQECVHLKDILMKELMNYSEGNKVNDIVPEIDKSFANTLFNAGRNLIEKDLSLLEIAYGNYYRKAIAIHPQNNSGYFKHYDTEDIHQNITQVINKSSSNIDLKNCGIDDMVMKFVIPKAFQNKSYNLKTIKHISFAWNKFGDQGAKSLANVISNFLPNLIGFDVEGNNISAEGMKALTPVLKKCKTIRLSSNNLDDNSIIYFLDLLTNNEDIRVIHAFANLFTQHGTLKLLKAIQSAPNITTFTVQPNPNPSSESLPYPKKQICKTLPTEVKDLLIKMQGELYDKKYNEIKDIYEKIKHIMDEYSGPAIEKAVEQAQLYLIEGCYRNKTPDRAISEYFELKKRLSKEELIKKLGSEVVCVYDDFPLDQISEALVQNPNQEYLCLGNVGVDFSQRTDSYIQNKFIEALAETRLQKLDVYNNKLGAVGVKLFTQALKNNSTLKYLGLTDTQLGVEGIKILKDVVISNKTLKILNLNNNNIGHDEGSKAIAEILIKSQSLANLDISNNNIQDKGIVNYIAKALGITKIKEVIMKNNGITDNGAECIIDHVHQETSIDISDNDISTVLMNQIQELGSIGDYTYFE